jgi:alpha-tubulin suppressor-like RCC1 family protein
MILALLASCGRLGFDDVPIAPGGGGTPGFAVAAGDSFTCAVRSGALWCWGNSESFQLGLAATARHTTPVAITTIPGAIATLDAGHASACAIDSAGAVWCWGANENGQLGNGAPGSPAIAQQVALPGIAVDVGVGYAHACAVLANATLWCWGRNDEQQIAPILTGTPIPSPMQVLDNVAHVATGDYFTCALRTDRSVWCWGDNLYGQLGTGGSGAQPQQVLVGATNALAAGATHVCAVVDGGFYSCWGSNGNDELGRVTTGTANELPGPSSTLGGFVAISAGNEFTCGMRYDGVAWCWGDAVVAEQGRGDTYDSVDPGALAITGTIVALASGGDHSCVLRDDNSVACWGGGSAGQLGNGFGSELTPQRVLLPAAAAAVAAGDAHACAIVGSDTYCWGNNNELQLGAATPATQGFTSNVPLQAAGVTGQVVLALGELHSCASNDSALVCWGSDDAGQVGDGMQQSAAAPFAVAVVPPFTALSAGSSYTCAISAGSLLCWGRDVYGEMGDGGGADRLAPMASGVANPMAVSAGTAHACEIDTAGALWCWGDCGDGQCSGSQATIQLPEQVAGSYSAVAAGNEHTCALTSQGGVVCFGLNADGELGDGTFANNGAPVTVNLPGPASAIAASSAASCALVSGVPYCWGDGSVGEHGDGTTLTSNTAVPVSLSNVTQLSLGDGFACALVSSGDVLCWGENLDGEIGNGRQSWALLPVEAQFP